MDSLIQNLVGHGNQAFATKTWGIWRAQLVVPVLSSLSNVLQQLMARRYNFPL